MKINRLFESSSKNSEKLQIKNLYPELDANLSNPLSDVLALFAKFELNFNESFKRPNNFGQDWQV
jgi:hypothetical protein